MCVMEKRRKYSAEVKHEAVQVARTSELPMSQVALDLGIRPILLTRLCRELTTVCTKVFQGHGKPRYERSVELDFSRPDKHTDNAFVESFNSSFHKECLNVYWFLSFDDAKAKAERWRNDYNQFRPHSSLENMTPSEFAANHRNSHLT